VISLFGTGLGQTVPSVTAVNGAITPHLLAAEAVVKIGSQPAKVTWAGLVGIGLYQLNIEVPSTLAPGDYATSVQVAGVESPAVQLPVR
jgi:uncharacterized protein (TIGR03437 family)